MPKKYVFSEDQVKEIQQAIKDSKSKAEYMRFECVRLRADEKMELEEIAKKTGYNKYYVSKVICLFAKNGADGLKSKKHSGRTTKLTIEEERELLKGFAEQAESGKILIVSDIHKAYEAKTGEKSPKSTIYNMLKRHKWRKVMPRSKHQKSDPIEQEAYKKNNRKNIPC